MTSGTGYADEHVDFTYDSAGRGRGARYTNGADQDLYQASTVDALGRVREAHYGLTTYTADYADIGRKLMKQVAVSSPQGSRKISYGTFGPIGRERSRTELKDSAGTSTTTNWTYDALGRLIKGAQTSGAATLLDQAFTYDPLGNLRSITSTGTEGGVNTTLGYSTTDRDRICHVAFGKDAGTDCNVTYDELGGILSQPTPTGTRSYTYLVDGSVRRVDDSQGNWAEFRYDAFGQVQQLDTGKGQTNDRMDRHYGLVTLRQERIDGAPPQPVYTRKIPLHDGSVATRHGPSGPWTFEYGEQRGNRFFTDENGAFVQNVDYQPYGTPASTGAPAGDQLYSTQQWNGGDSLAALGISQLGARLYDPAIGRFTSRDPLLILRTAATSNPYAFADNDPVNSSDPNGLITGCVTNSIARPCQKDGNGGDPGSGTGGDLLRPGAPLVLPPSHPDPGPVPPPPPEPGPPRWLRVPQLAPGNPNANAKPRPLRRPNIVWAISIELQSQRPYSTIHSGL